MATLVFQGFCQKMFGTSPRRPTDDPILSRINFWRKRSFSHWVTVLLFLIIFSTKATNQFIVIVWLLNVINHNLWINIYRGIDTIKSWCVFNKLWKSDYGKVFRSISRPIICQNDHEEGLHVNSVDSRLTET